MAERGVYTYAYPRPMVTVDAVVFAGAAPAPQVLLIRRNQPPFAGCWALPGGFVEQDESLAAAAARELQEETGLIGLVLKQLHTFGEPGRDPRGRTISVAYWGWLPEAMAVRAGDDAGEAAWFSTGDPPQLAFDHLRIVEYGLERIRQEQRACI